MIPAMAAPTPAPPREVPADGRYLFAVLEDSDAVRSACAASQGDGADVELVSAAGLCAAVSPVPAAFRRLAAAFDSARTDAPSEGELPAGAARELEDAVRLHERTVERLAGAGPLLPARMGTVLRTRRDVGRLLERRAAEFQTQLAEVGRCREWGVGIWLCGETAQALQAARLSGDEPPTDRGPGRAYLDDRKRALQESEALERLCAEHRDRIRSTLTAVAKDVAEAPASSSRARSGGALPVLSASFLLDPDEVGRFFAQLERALAAEDGLLAESSGPWPPYGFVQIRVDEGAG